MPMQRRGAALRHYERRRTWLEARPELYAQVPGLHDDVTDEGRAALAAVVLLMKAEKLLSATLGDTNRETVRRLVSELRGEHTGLAW